MGKGSKGQRLRPVPRRTPAPARPAPAPPGPPALANLEWGNSLSLAVSAAMRERRGAPGSPGISSSAPRCPLAAAGRARAAALPEVGALPSSLRLKGSKICKKNPSFVVTTPYATPNADPLGEMEIWDYKHVCM